jgi:hypothetical protein
MDVHAHLRNMRPLRFGTMTGLGSEDVATDQTQTTSLGALLAIGKSPLSIVAHSYLSRPSHRRRPSLLLASRVVGHIDKRHKLG